MIIAFPGTIPLIMRSPVFSLVCGMLVLMMFGSYSCRSSKRALPTIQPTVNEGSAKPAQPVASTAPEATSGPTKPYSVDAPRPVMVYKTKKDYSHQVPVILNAGRTAILSYPAVGDLGGEEFSYPTLLYGGYLLDNRGIDVGVAFLDYTYEQYAKLDPLPSADELMKHILDADPLSELYSCSCVFDTAVVNALIRTGELKNCNKLK
jgi:hypothetical protein